MTSTAAHFVDTFFVPDVRDDEEKYGDAFGNALVEWWDGYFGPHEPRDSRPLRKDVTAFVTDNVNYNIGAFKRHWRQRFPEAQHVRCVAHVLNLVGAMFRDHPCLSVWREFMAKARSILKGKRNIRRRRRLGQFLKAVLKKDVPNPPDWADTRWSGWYDCACWYGQSFQPFRQWLAKEAGSSDAPATVTDLHTWLGENAHLVLLQLVFVIENADEVFQLLEDIQVSVASTFVPSKHPRRAKPIMHSVYNKLHGLHTKLQNLADSKCLGTATESQLTRKNHAGKSKYDVSKWRASFLDVVQGAATKLWKYVGKNMELAKQARILDPRLIGALSEDIGEYDLVFPPRLQSEIVQSGASIENQLQAIPASLTFWNGGRECHCVFPSCTLMHGEFWPFPTLLVM